MFCLFCLFLSYQKIRMLAEQMSLRLLSKMIHNALDLFSHSSDCGQIMLTVLSKLCGLNKTTTKKKKPEQQQMECLKTFATEGIISTLVHLFSQRSEDVAAFESERRHGCQRYFLLRYYSTMMASRYHYSHFHLVDN